MCCKGKELSYNNILDADAALQLVLEFTETVCVAIKHTNPCGAALAQTPLEAFRKARLCDPVSIFGGIVAFNREVDEATAHEMKDVFLEIVIAPRFSRAALDLYSSSQKLRNVRLLEVDLGGADRRARGSWRFARYSAACSSSRATSSRRTPSERW